MRPFELCFAAFFVSHVPKHRLREFFDAARARSAPGGQMALLAVIGPARDIEFEQGRYFWRLAFRVGSQPKPVAQVR